MGAERFHDDGKLDPRDRGVRKPHQGRDSSHRQARYHGLCLQGARWPGLDHTTLECGSRARHARYLLCIGGWMYRRAESFGAFTAHAYAHRGPFSGRWMSIWCLELVVLCTTGRSGDYGDSDRRRACPQSRLHRLGSSGTYHWRYVRKASETHTHELGGKCPAIVLDDADLEKAATLCARGALLHHGQICFSTERIIVQKTVSEKFLELLVAAVKSMPGGTAVTEGIAQHAYEVLQDAKEKGVKFVYGGPEMASKSAVKPALVQIEPTTRKEDLRIVDEETFGPSASIYVVEDDEEAIAIANRSAYGLNATIHTQSLERGIKVGRELEYGQVYCNSIIVYTSPTGPQGGRKGSGWGRQNAEWGIEELLVEKFITYHGRESG